MTRTRSRLNIAALSFTVVLSLSLGLLSYGQRNTLSGSAPAPDNPIFMIPSNYPVGPRAMGIAVADLNGDGRLDLAACNPYDKDGRHYRVRVSARDRAGNRAEQWKIVTVPHDQR
jgi:hypothetical protein